MELKFTLIEKLLCSLHYIVHQIILFSYLRDFGKFSLIICVEGFMSLHAARVAQSHIEKGALAL